MYSGVTRAAAGTDSFSMCLSSFAQGSNGIYFGGKDFMLSELSGSFALSAEVVPSTVKGEEGQHVARLSMRVGSSAAAPAK